MSLFTKAKQRSLPDFAMQGGFKLRKQGSGYASRCCPHCIESDGANDALSIYPQEDVWRWNCFRCHRGGTVIDFAAAHWGCTDIDAAKRLCDGAATTPVAAVPKRNAETTPEGLASALSILSREGYTSVAECVSYLNGRGISDSTISGAIQRGILRFLPADPHASNRRLHQLLGNPGLRESGLLKPGSKWPAIAFRPIIFFLPGGSSAEFRLARDPKEAEPKAIRYGNTKWPWFWKEGERAKTIYVREGAIDMLSSVELGLKFGEAILAIPGTDAWRPEWFAAARKAHPDAKFSLGFDNDEPGEIATSVIAEELKTMGAEVLYQPPPSEYHDWNKYLTELMQAKKAA